MPKTSQEVFKDGLDKAFVGVGLNQGTMADYAMYKQGVKEDKLEDSAPMIRRSIKKLLSKKKETKEQEKKKYLDIEDMIPELRRQLNKGTMFDKDLKKDNKEPKKKETKEQDEVTEKWSEKYKKSIDCSNPKGFSQKAHCDGRKKKETKEATGSGSSGAFVGPVFGGDNEFWERSKSENPKLKEQVEKVEATEATGSGSVGVYSQPAMWAKSTKKKDWGPSRKTQIPGGGFVKVKKKCTKFPYCNQGDINNIKISKNESVKEAIQMVANKMGISPNVVMTILEHEYENVNKRTK